MAADALKQRLVGGATLLLVGTIAWFWLLSADSPVDPVTRESQIPPAPDIQPFAVQEPARPQNIEPIGSARDTAPALQSDAVPVPAPQPIAAATPAPKPAQAATAPRVDTAKAAATRSAPAKATAATSSAQAAPKTTVPASATKTPVAAKTPTETKPATAKVDTKLAGETFQLDQHGLPIAWVVQVGLFSTQAAADKVKATLQAEGFKAYTQPFKSEKASGIKVFVGPKLSRERADAQKKKIDELLKTNTLVVRFVAN